MEPLNPLPTTQTTEIHKADALKADTPAAVPPPASEARRGTSAERRDCVGVEGGRICSVHLRTGLASASVCREAAENDSSGMIGTHGVAPLPETDRT